MLPAPRVWWGPPRPKTAWPRASPPAHPPPPTPLSHTQPHQAHAYEYVKAEYYIQARGARFYVNVRWRVLYSHNCVCSLPPSSPLPPGAPPPPAASSLPSRSLAEYCFHNKSLVRRAARPSACSARWACSRATASRFRCVLPPPPCLPSLISAPPHVLGGCCLVCCCRALACHAMPGSAAPLPRQDRPPAGSATHPRSASCLTLSLSL